MYTRYFYDVPRNTDERRFQIEKRAPMLIELRFFFRIKVDRNAKELHLVDVILT